MTVIDISCPSCGRAGSVRKEAIGSYRCDECGHEFDRGDLDPFDQTSG